MLRDSTCCVRPGRPARVLVLAVDDGEQSLNGRALATLPHASSLRGVILERCVHVPGSKGQLIEAFFDANALIQCLQPQGKAGAYALPVERDQQTEARAREACALVAEPGDVQFFLALRRCKVCRAEDGHDFSAALDGSIDVVLVRLAFLNREAKIEHGRRWVDYREFALERVGGVCIVAAEAQKHIVVLGNWRRGAEGRASRPRGIVALIDLFH